MHFRGNVHNINVFFHPDCNCRLWNLTRSTFRLAGCTAGGESRPALKILYSKSIARSPCGVNHRQTTISSKIDFFLLMVLVCHLPVE